MILYFTIIRVSLLQILMIPHSSHTRWNMLCLLWVQSMIYMLPLQIAGLKQHASCGHDKMWPDSITTYYFTSWFYSRECVVFYCYWSLLLYFIIPLATKLGGVYWIHPVCLSVRLSVCPSVCLLTFACPPCSIYSSGWILSIFDTNDQ